MRRIVLWLTVVAVSRAPAQAPALKLIRDLRVDGEVTGLSEVGDIAASRSGVLAVSQPQDRLSRRRAAADHREECPEFSRYHHRRAR